MNTQKSWDERFIDGLESREAQERIVNEVKTAGRRFRKLAKQRPILACALAVASGYIAGRLVTRI